MRVIVTRPLAQARPWVQALRDAGLDAVALPLIGIEAPADPAAVTQAWADVPQAAMVFFVSPNAVERFFEMAPAGARWPKATLAGSTGPGTSAALWAAGVPAECVVAPEEGAQVLDSTVLWESLRHRSWHGRSVLIVRGEGGRDWLAEQLRTAGAHVGFVAAYQRCAPKLSADERTLLDTAAAQRDKHLWLFSSSEAIATLVILAPSVFGSDSVALVTHPRIADAARRAGVDRVLECAPAMPAVIAALRRCSIQSEPL